MITWEVTGKLNGEPIVLVYETADDCTRAEARDDMQHSIPMVDGEFKGFPKIDWRTLKAAKHKELPNLSIDSLSVN
jgi:hypothetical protein